MPRPRNSRADAESGQLLKSADGAFVAGKFISRLLRFEANMLHTRDPSFQGATAKHRSADKK
jgi:hypothetical protein